MKNSLYVLIFFTVLVAAITLVYKSVSPYLPEDTLANLERDGGVYSSHDSGITWRQDAQFSAGEQKDFVRANVFALAFHPGDAEILYAATTQGLFMRSEVDQGRWLGLVAGRPVFAIDINPKDRQTVFIATENEFGQGEIARSQGEVFDFLQVFTTPTTTERIIDVVADFFDTNTVLALTSMGAFLRSDDEGDSWRIAHRFAGGNAKKLLMDPGDSRVLYVVTDEGLFSSTDKGDTWRERTGALASFSGGNVIHDIAIAENNSSLLYLATDYGILRSQNGGGTFLGVEFLFPFGTEPITAVALFPQDSRKVWVAVGPQIYQSTDGGESWQVRSLSTARAIRVIAPDPLLQTTIFVGVNTQ